MLNIKRVFLIDDDPLLNVVHRQLILNAGFTGSITTFENARDALSEIDRIRKTDLREMPEILFLDVYMPGISGWEFLQEFERMGLTMSGPCRVYMLSATINPDDVARAESFGFVEGVINKALSIDKLKELFTY